MEGLSTGLLLAAPSGLGWGGVPGLEGPSALGVAAVPSAAVSGLPVVDGSGTAHLMVAGVASAEAAAAAAASAGCSVALSGAGCAQLAASSAAAVVVAGLRSSSLCVFVGCWQNGGRGETREVSNRKGFKIVELLC